MKALKALKGNKGFTMIEMVVILAVIAILAAVLTPMTLKYINDAKMSRAESDVKAIANAVLALNNDTRDWPVRLVATSTTDDINTLVGSGDGAVTGSATVPTSSNDDIADHLTSNTVGYSSTGKYKWRGPYMERIDADPWGTAYYVDVIGLQKLNLGNNDKTAFALSAGPDEALDTTLDGSATVAADDDILYRIK